MKFRSCHHCFFHPSDERNKKHPTTTPLGTSGSIKTKDGEQIFQERLGAAPQSCKPSPSSHRGGGRGEKKTEQPNPSYFRHLPNLRVPVDFSHPEAEGPHAGETGAFYSVEAGVVPAHRVLLGDEES